MIRHGGEPTEFGTVNVKRGQQSASGLLEELHHRCPLLFLFPSPLHASLRPIMNKFTIFSALLYSVSALTIPLALRDVAVPPVTEPTESTVWVVGTTQTVKWDISDLPPRENISNPLGKVVLGFLTDDSYNLSIDSPLAEGFDILDGKVDITVPQVESKDNYIVAVIGNSGNISPMFRILPSGSAAALAQTTSIDPNDSQWNSPPLTGSVITGGPSESRTTTTFVDPSSGVPGATSIIETSAPETTATEPTQSTEPTESEESPDASEPADSEPEPTGASRRSAMPFSAAFAPVVGAVVVLLI